MRTKTMFAFGGLFAAALSTAPALHAQQFPSFGSLEGRVGAYFPSEADAGFGATALLGLGYIGSPVLRTFIGANYFTADTNRQGAEGSIDAIGGLAGVRLDPFGVGRLTPYVTAMVTAHDVSADVQPDAVAGALEGFYVGAGAGVGLTYSLDQQDRFALTAEGRRVFTNNIGHWAGEIGIRVIPLGRAAYTPPLPPLVVVEEDDRADVDAAVLAERERLRLERERLERETELERLRAAAAAETVRLRTDREAELLRQRGESLEFARQQEAAARAAAEREATAARAEADAASVAAREAQQRAAAAEDQLYDALTNLDRLISNVTAIRETERGLAVVLGQGLFASGQAALSPRARDEVGRIAAVLAQYPDRTVVVEGHTDAVGSEVANQRLSERRAEAVRAALIAQGVQPARVQMAGYGESQPVADNATATGRAENRRVEIVIVGARRPGNRGGE